MRKNFQGDTRSAAMGSLAASSPACLPQRRLAGCGSRRRRERHGIMLPERVERAPQFVVEHVPPA
ncbi:MAG: hypothetical protein ABTQ28_18780 [Thauera sp.]